MDNRKEEIVEVATKRFSHYGFNKTTMNEIAEDLRITKANLYYYYPDKNALIKDVLYAIAQEANQREVAIIDGYDHNLMDTLFALLELRSSYVRKYYVLHLSENLEWIKGLELTNVLIEFHKRDVSNVKRLLAKAIESGEVKIADIDCASLCFVEIVRGLGIMHNIADIVTGLPNVNKVDKILESQKRATEFIFEGKIVSKQL
ncbi:TetR/AcrR family transcriptional regulator [Sphingobacterium olei]|uniref:TetR/AcrR family transcriptional regulator n=1 Tax=Sphingobacterium olei TaxID=2571155 RepID=A0A4U0PIT4_9SPHI|nr:TetR/AcrR family transcriptional regulator [Sphingobacterium olei]TJZ62814.1 TetR/AcrR family transcriptional regulator [Sphingobacterium olei]